MKRQRGRNRGGGGGQPGGKPQNANRAFDSNGPDNIKVRGHAQHVFEKYQQLARDATSSGDRVLAENFLQHAEHYFRVLRTLQPNRPVSDFIARETFASGYDIDFEDESGAQALPEETPQESEQARVESEGQDQQPREPRQWENRGDRQPREQRDGQYRDNRDRDRNFRDRDRERPRYENDGGEARSDGEYRSRDRYRDRDDRAPREDRSRDDRPRDDRPRDERPRDERPRDERPRDERSRDERPRDDRTRDERPREERQPREDRGERRDRNFDRASREDRAERSDPLAVVEPQAQPLTEVAEARAETRAPRRKEAEESHMPAFLQAATPAPAAAATEDAPKRRGRPKKVKEETSTEEA